MSNTSIKREYEKCKEYSENIIDLLKDKLTEKKISFVENGKNEIVVKGKTKKSIIKIIDSLDIDSSIKETMIDVSYANNKTYIRQNFS